MQTDNKLLKLLAQLHSDERHPRPGTKRPREADDEEEEEDLNESNYDEVS